VGSDASLGLRSPLRHSLRPDDPGVRYAGYTSLAGDHRGTLRSRLGRRNLGQGRTLGCAPLRDGRVYWFATASVPAGTATADERAEVLRRFGAWHDPIPALIAATGGGEVLHHDINNLAGRLGSFARGRVALIGDSAHAMTPDLGQGGCLAIEDAR
jgi:2-polyprenyl-6-methoxyphenol hydroxylase-like FAD-dependent oxidoreductase